MAARDLIMAAAGVGGAADPQFNYVTMLLHGDGTNGAQNNTFLDSSTNNFTITRSGNTTQGSFSPYGSNWSNFFPSSSYLEIANNTALQMSTGDFTIEFWLNFSSLSNYQTIFTKGYNNAGGLLVQTNTGTGTLLVYVAGSVVITASSASTLGTWNHYALVRNSGTLTLYLNGTSVGSVSNSTNFNNTESFNVGGSVSGYYTNGYISNFRVVKGTAVYTGSFTPSTTPLTAITNTQLLTCQSNRFVDNSANAFSSTITGTPSVQRFNPFGTSTAYSTSVIGGSGYFDGTGDYLISPASSSYQFAGDFTIEYWANLSNISGVMPIGQTYTGNNFQIYYSADGSIEFGGSNLGLVSTSAGVIVKNSWHHGALVRNGSTVTLYINGVSRGTITSSSTVGNNADIGIGARPNNAYNCTGYISNVRLVSSAVYTTTFTPPTTPFTAISGTVLLLSTINGAIFDNAMMNDLETVGNAQISTSVKKYGTGSLAFDGTGDWLTSNAPANLNAFGTGNFTVECWVYLNTIATQQILFDFRTNTNDVAGAFYCDGTSLAWFVTGSNRISGGTLTANTWHHVALCRSGTSTKIFLNGSQVGSTYTDSNNYICLSGRPFLGALSDSTGTLYLNGYIDDARITKGYARYTATFTPPTSALSDTGPY